MPLQNVTSFLAAIMLLVSGAVLADEPAAAVKRLPIPSKEEAQKAGEALLAKIEAQHPGTVKGGSVKEESKADVADELIAWADSGELDASGRYMANKLAYEFAIELGYPILMGHAIGRLGGAYDLDASKLVVSGYETMLATSHPSLVYRDLVREALGLARRYAAVLAYAEAKRMTEIALAAADKAKSKSLRKAAEATDNAMGEYCRLLDEFRKASAVLAKTPDDPAAFLAMGSFLCFVDEDWKRGLPALAAGSDSTLAALAKKTIATGPTDARASLEVADQWWRVAAASGQPQKDAIEAYAFKLYTAALPGLKGDDGTRVVVLLRNWVAKHPSNHVVIEMFAALRQSSAPTTDAALPRRNASSRTFWKYEKDGKIVTYRQEADGKWVEMNLRGNRTTFELVESTSEYVEFIDRRRDISIRLFDGRSEIRVGAKPYGPWYPGKWVDDDQGPAPTATASGPASSQPAPTNPGDHPPLDARTAEHIRRAIADRQTVDTMRSGSGGTNFRDVPEDGALVVAVIVYWKDDDRMVASGVQVVYQTATGQRRSPVFGRAGKRAGITNAKIGYALGGVRIPQRSVIEGTDLVMMRVEGLRLDRNNTHGTRTRGGQPDNPPSQVLGLNGSLVVGITGTTGDDGSLTGFGLVTVR